MCLSSLPQEFFRFPGLILRESWNLYQTTALLGYHGDKQSAPQTTWPLFPFSGQMQQSLWPFSKIVHKDYHIFIATSSEGKLEYIYSHSMKGTTNWNRMKQGLRGSTTSYSYQTELTITVNITPHTTPPHIPPEPVIYLLLCQVSRKASLMSFLNESIMH